MRFLSALRAHGSDGTLLTWGGEGWWHCAVLVEGTDIVIDWTAAQFADALRDAPFPHVETKAQAEARWGPSAVLDIDSPEGRMVGNLPELLPWPEAGKRIPERDSDEAEHDRH